MGALIVIITISNIPLYFTDETGAAVSVSPTIIASILVDLTVVFIFLDMMYSTFRIGKFRKQIMDQEA